MKCAGSGIVLRGLLEAYCILELSTVGYQTCYLSDPSRGGGIVRAVARINADDIPTWRGTRKIHKSNFTKQLKHETDCQDGTPGRRPIDGPRGGDCLVDKGRMIRASRTKGCR